MKEFLSYDANDNLKRQAIFASVFVIQNRLQTACEKVQTQISMRQWHLLAMSQLTEGPKTLTETGKLMGCSRQNVKKLAEALAKKGLIELIDGANNSVSIKITDKANEYLSSMTEVHDEVLNRLFSDFTAYEIGAMFKLQNKILDGLERVEDYAKGARSDK